MKTATERATAAAGAGSYGPFHPAVDRAVFDRTSGDDPLPERDANGLIVVDRTPDDDPTPEEWRGERS